MRNLYAAFAGAILAATVGCAPLDRAPGSPASEAAPSSAAADAPRTVAAPAALSPPAPAEAGLEEIVVTSARAERGAARADDGPGRLRHRAPAPPPAVAMADREPAERPAIAPVLQHLGHETGPVGETRQAGQLTAGDHDDLLNAAAYDRYAHRFLRRYGRQDFPVLDADRRLTVTVRGSDGRPAPLVAVDIRSADGRRRTLQTKADGRIVLFPGLDRLGARVELTARDADGATRSETVQLSGRPRDVTLTLPSEATPVRALDIVLVMDTTGSMSDELDYLTAELADILTGVRERHGGLDVRTGLVFYRDVGDEYTVRTYPFTDDPAAVRRSLARQSANGGGDMPEAMHAALAEANAYPWREDAVKVMLLVADAPPHAGDVSAAWTAGLAARARGVHILPVAASGVDDDAQYLMRAMAAASQGRYVFITDDSGIGNAHAEPTIDCYVVTRLDGLLSRVISSLVSGRRVEPAGRDVVRKVGDDRRGVCRGPG